jgi:hypothetical protein
MIDPLQTILIVVSVLELGLLAQAVIGVGQLVSGGRDVDGAVFVGYLLGCVVFLPLATVWALGERTRGGTAVLVVAGLVLPVLVVRIQQVWSGG